MKENILEETLLNTGTGLLEGFFRLPVDLNKYSIYRDDRNYFDNPENHNDRDYKKNFEDFERKNLKLGDDLKKFQNYHECPTINLSDKNGKFLGTYEITEFDFYEDDPDVIEFFLDLKHQKNSGTRLQVHTCQKWGWNRIGSCLIYFDECEDALFDFKLK